MATRSRKPHFRFTPLQCHLVYRSCWLTADLVYDCIMALPTLALLPEISELMVVQGSQQNVDVFSSRETTLDTQDQEDSRDRLARINEQPQTPKNCLNVFITFKKRLDKRYQDAPSNLSCFDFEWSNKTYHPHEVQDIYKADRMETLVSDLEAFRGLELIEIPKTQLKYTQNLAHTIHNILSDTQPLNTLTRQASKSTSKDRSLLDQENSQRVNASSLDVQHDPVNSFKKSQEVDQAFYDYLEIQEMSTQIPQQKPEDFRALPVFEYWHREEKYKQVFLLEGASRTSKIRFIECRLHELGYAVVRCTHPECLHLIRSAEKSGHPVALVFDEYPWETLSDRECANLLDPCHISLCDTQGGRVQVGRYPRVVIAREVPKRFLATEAIMNRLTISTIGQRSLFVRSKPRNSGNFYISQDQLEGRNVDPVKIDRIGRQDGTSIYRFRGSYREFCALFPKRPGRPQSR